MESPNPVFPNSHPFLVSHPYYNKLILKLGHPKMEKRVKEEVTVTIGGTLETPQGTLMHVPRHPCWESLL